jgi:pimeloyl-ACP methyl ester carboxylesterase
VPTPTEHRRWRLQRELMQTDPDSGVDTRVLGLLRGHHASSHRVVTEDGTSISYKRFGSGEHTVAFCNGLGGTYRTFAEVISRLLPNVQAIVFDYRGLFESGPPGDPEALGVDAHARDLFAVLDDAGVQKATVFGWSMGVQVALEAYRIAPERLDGLVFASGVEGKVLESVLVIPGSPELSLKLLSLIAERGGTATQLLARTCRTSAVKSIARRLGLVGRNADVTMEHAALMLSCDPNVYLRIIERLHQHDASDLLSQIAVPTLILHGDSDVITPVWKGRAMRAKVPDSEIWVFAGCTHGVILEFPERVSARVEDFLQRRVYPATKAPR